VKEVTQSEFMNSLTQMVFPKNHAKTMKLLIQIEHHVLLSNNVWTVSHPLLPPDRMVNVTQSKDHTINGKFLNMVVLQELTR